MKACRVHCFDKAKTTKHFIFYRCCTCGQGKRRYRPGHRPAYLRETA